MKKFLYLFFLIANTNYAQVNLVPNGDFETYNSCPTGASQITKAIPWFQPFTPQSSTDYFNICYTGNYVGVPNNIL